MRGLNEELETVRREVIAGAILTAFREYATEIIFHAQDMNAPVRTRLALFISGIGPEVREDALLAGRDPQAWMWDKVSRKTATRDLARLEALGLIVREEGLIRPRLQIMERFKR